MDHFQENFDSHILDDTGASPQESPVSFTTLKNPDTYKLSGTIERISYFNEETGQCVLDIRPDSYRAHVLVAARLPFVYPGQSVETVVLVNPSQRQALLSMGAVVVEGPLQAREIQIRPPVNERTAKKFLKSGALPSVKPAMAAALAKAFSENLFLMLDEHPGSLVKVSGIGKKRQNQIIESWAEFKFKTSFEQYLFEQGLPLNWAKALWPTHGIESLQFLKTQPYRTVTEFSFSFELVDAFALREGFRLDSVERIRCGLYDLLQTHYKQGHCAYPETKFLQEARSLLKVGTSLLEDVLELELLQENLVSETIESVSCLYLKKIWELEKDVASQLLAFRHRETPWGYINFGKALGWAQQLLQIRLAPLQKKAVETAMSSPLTVITGGPGTGKTTLIRSLVTILQTQHARFALCSPTGRAAQRLGEATGAPAQTIHRLLKFNHATGKFSYNARTPLDLDLVLVDEVSMVDLALMSQLLEALPVHCMLVLVGDADQLPSVGAGSILQSILASGQFQTVTLTDIFRHSEKSLIKTNAQRINAGLMPLTSTEGGKADFHYFPVTGVENTKKTIVDLFTRVIPNHCGITDPAQFQILTPLNRGPLGTQQLNLELQDYLAQKQSLFSDEVRDSEENSESVTGFGHVFWQGDKVMVIKNDYIKDVFNGDIGFIRHIDHHGQFIDVEFDHRIVQYPFDQLDRLTLAYAISIHKSQGSEYRAVVVVLANEHLSMAQRHLIYTAVTRGKEHVFLVADPEALQVAIQSDDRRWQKLTELLREAE